MRQIYRQNAKNAKEARRAAGVSRLDPRHSEPAPARQVILLILLSLSQKEQSNHAVIALNLF
jgi:hypothetical protein